MNFLILSKRRSNGIAMWWRPDSRGYTNDVDAAGRYSADESARIVRNSPNEMRVPESAVGRLLTTRRIVDIGDEDNHRELMAFEGA